MEIAPIVEYLCGHAIKDTLRECILKVLEVRLHPNVADAFKPVLGSIEDLKWLEELFEGALKIHSVEEFRHLLQAGGYGVENGAAGQR